MQWLCPKLTWVKNRQTWIEKSRKAQADPHEGHLSGPWAHEDHINPGCTVGLVFQVLSWLESLREPTRLNLVAGGYESQA
jgi:hypothetical protein